MKVKKPVILAYHMKEADVKRLEDALQGLGISVQPVTGRQESAPLGMLAGAEGVRGVLPMPGSYGRLSPSLGIHAGGPAGAAIAEPMILMAGLTEHQLDRVLAILHRGSVKVGLKAILTETNASWNGRQLAAELQKERERLS